MDASSKIGILKALEVECYSICYYVLQQETLATQASKETMQELWSSESFYLQDADHRLKALKQLALASDCPSCKEVIGYLKRKNTPYELFDVSFSKQYFKEMMRLGGFATPFIVMDELRLYYFDPRVLDRFLEEQHR